MLAVTSRPAPSRQVTLAAEAGLCYAAVAMPTDYDCWRPGEGVSVDMVMATFRANVQSVTRLIREAVPRIAKQDWAQTLREKQVSAAAVGRWNKATVPGQGLASHVFARIFSYCIF